jgi:murein DD-endopeptidase MepM/ murein hydrolase activator NlpD
VTKTTPPGAARTNIFLQRWLPTISWGIAILLAGMLLILLVQKWMFGISVFAESSVPALPPVQVDEVIPEESSANAVLPGYEFVKNITSIYRDANPHTIIPTRERMEAVTYTVQAGDSVFSIANQYKLKPETVLWANYDQLDDNPNMLSIGMELVIPPVDGVYYTWQANDSIEAVAGRFKVTPDKILSWPTNKLDLTAPVIEAGTNVMIPDGWRENRQWLVPTIWRANSGASRLINGPGACDLPASGAFGSGTFIWPTGNTYLSGNDYWSGHLGIDIAAATGAPVVAADSGLVVYAGSIGGGYGLMVMIDHGNGYHTLYAHLSSINTNCGSSVYQGGLIGLAGSTGNSTGPHLHFEVRYQGGFINPWYVLP